MIANSDDIPFEDSERVLCVDGDCIGVIGADGRCKVCGRPGPATGPETGSETAALAADEPAQAAVDAAAQAAVDAAAQAAVSDSTGRDETDDLDFAQRRLCPDGLCIGVIGADGRCKICGAVAP